MREPTGGFKSMTMMVVITAKTPSENAISLSVEVALPTMSALIRFDWPSRFGQKLTLPVSLPR